ncbi:unnamed protein product [Durusdinium trenchii]|uniref:Pentacotripeptide-repeat region of PRORP domain-containing protein n=1 Tax=Durusdinium trenchii TaxID=1381693 RepID=A0ABP0KVQ0_9DINO
MNVKRTRSLRRTRCLPRRPLPPTAGRQRVVHAKRSDWLRKERQQRVFLPVDDPPPPSKRPAAEDSRVSSSRESQRLNAWAQRFLKGLAEKASMDSSKTCQELSDILEAERVNMAEETYVALVELCVEAQNLPDASRLYSEMEAKGFKAQNDLTDQVIGLYSKTQAK